MAPRIISLDLDDTLWPIAPVIEAAELELLSWLTQHHPLTLAGGGIEAMRQLRAEVALRFPEQSHDMTFLRRRALGEHFAAAGYPAPHDEDSPAAEAMEVFLRERNRVRLYEDVRPTLLRLRSTHRLFALSNGNADLARCGIADLFDGHVTASQAGAAKPDARIFQHLLRVAAVEPAEVLHIGDDPLADVVGATRAGMQTVWLNREGRLWPKEFGPSPRTVMTLREIL